MIKSKLILEPAIVDLKIGSYEWANSCKSGFYSKQDFGGLHY